MSLPLPPTPPQSGKRKPPKPPAAAKRQKIKKTDINDENIHELVQKYCNDKTSLPPDLQHAAIGTWDVSNVTNMAGLFKDCTHFNEDLSGWHDKVAGVHSMESMFENATDFNHPLPWDVRAVITTKAMFKGATSFNSSLQGWNPTELQDASEMFDGATDFNQPIDWPLVHALVNTSYMFQGATAFDSSIKLGYMRIYEMQYMFAGATSFNQPLNGYDENGNEIPFVFDYTENMSHMFYGATSFNQNLKTDIEMLNDANMESMFENATAFDGELDFNVSNVTNFKRMFKNAVSFTGRGLIDWEPQLYGIDWEDDLAPFESMFEGATNFDLELPWIDPDEIPLPANPNQPSVVRDLYNSIFQGAGPNARFIAPPYDDDDDDDDNDEDDEDDEDDDANAAPTGPQAPQVLQQPAQGRAFEIHNATNYIDMQIVANSIKGFLNAAISNGVRVMNSRFHVDFTGFQGFNIDNWHKPFMYFMQHSVKPLYEQSAPGTQQFETFDEFMHHFTECVQRASTYSQPNNNIINGIVQFLLFQNTQFIKMYLETFTYDVMHAYPGAHGASCVKGAYERIIMSLGSASTKYLSLPEVQNMQPNYDNALDVYQILKQEIEPASYLTTWARKYHEVFAQPEVQNAIGMELTEEQQQGLSEEQIEAVLAERKIKRKEHFRQYFIDLYRQSGAQITPHKLMVIEHFEKLWLPDNAYAGGRRRRRLLQSVNRNSTHKPSAKRHKQTKSRGLQQRAKQTKTRQRQPHARHSRRTRHSRGTRHRRRTRKIYR